MSRRTARKHAFLTLYQSDVTGQFVSSILNRWRRYRGELEEYAEKLSRGVENKKEALDTLLDEVARGWPVHRMSVVDRNILRLALYEMIYVEDVPPEVAIGEAMELAKGFSSDEAPHFVGGVLRGAREAGLLEDSEVKPERRVGYGG